MPRLCHSSKSVLSDDPHFLIVRVSLSLEDHNVVPDFLGGDFGSCLFCPEIDVADHVDSNDAQTDQVFRVLAP